MSKKSRMLRSQVDDSFVGGGHQVVKARERERIIPEWMNSDTKIQKILLLAFPKLRTNSLQRSRAALWVRVIQLYFRAHYTNRQVAEEMDLSIPQVKTILVSIRRVADGKRANGTGSRTGNRGRPKSRP